VAQKQQQASKRCDDWMWSCCGCWILRQPCKPHVMHDWVNLPHCSHAVKLPTTIQV
jgi:hypothetical protein